MSVTISTIRRSVGLFATGALVTALTMTATPGKAQAQEADAVSGTGKGIVGGALLGGEIVMITMAAIGVEQGWPYFVFGGLGAAGGGIGGFFIEDATTDTPEVPLYMLAGGMALVIPTLVATLNATAYKPPESDQTETPTPSSEPAAPAPGAPAGGGTVKIQSKAPPRVPISVVDVYDGDLALGVPAVDVRPTYTRRELAIYGVKQRAEVRLPVFKASF